MGRTSARRRLQLAAVIVFLAAAPSFAETAGEAEKRLDDCLYYSKELGRGGDTLIVDLEDTVAKVGRTETLARLHADACVWRAETLLATRDEKLEGRAVAYLEKVADTPTDDPAFVKRAVGGLVEVHVRRGARLEATDARGALAEYEKAITRNPDDERPYKSIGGLTARTAEADIAEQRYDAALEGVNRNRARIAAKLGESNEAVKQLDALGKRILDTTCVIEFRWLGSIAELRKLQGKVAEFVGGELRFEKSGTGTTPVAVKLEPGAEKRLPRGQFTASAVGKNGGTYPVAVDLRGERSTVTLPAALPEGMVIVPATPELDAFLIDRTEVPRSAFAPFAAKNDIDYFRGDTDDSLPARGMTYDDAEKYAESIGKRLPTEAQWKRAALGTRDGGTRKYPWAGDSFKPGEQFVGMGVSSGPRSVKSCEAGASDFGAINMVGNVMEWIQPGWALGGAYSMPGMSAPVRADDTEGTIAWPEPLQFLKDPIPSSKCVDAGVLPTGRSRNYYPTAAQVGNDDQLRKTGLRCVFPLGRPKEKP